MQDKVFESAVWSCSFAVAAAGGSCSAGTFADCGIQVLLTSLGAQCPGEGGLVGTAAQFQKQLYVKNTEQQAVGLPGAAWSSTSALCPQGLSLGFPFAHL